jgi:hypothetical protein
MSAEDPLAAGLRKLAQTTVDEMNALGEAAPLDHRLETMKIVSALYFGLEKLSAKVSDEPTGRNMKDWVREISTVSGGSNGDAQH